MYSIAGCDSFFVFSPQELAITVVVPTKGFVSHHILELALLSEPQKKQQKTKIYIYLYHVTSLLMYVKVWIK